VDQFKECLSGSDANSNRPSNLFLRMNKSAVFLIEMILVGGAVEFAEAGML